MTIKVVLALGVSVIGVKAGSLTGIEDDITVGVSVSVTGVKLIVGTSDVTWVWLSGTAIGGRLVEVVAGVGVTGVWIGVGDVVVGFDTGISALVVGASVGVTVTKVDAVKSPPAIWTSPAVAPHFVCVTIAGPPAKHDSRPGYWLLISGTPTM
jgi:hypothetical protein